GRAKPALLTSLPAAPARVLLGAAGSILPEGAHEIAGGAVPRGAALCAPATKSLPPPTPHGRGRRTSRPRPFRGWAIRRAKVIFVGSKKGRMRIEYVSPDVLRPFEGNPRTISERGLEKLQRSVEEFGFTNPILVQRGTNMIIAGHQRLKAAKAAGLTEVPVVYLDMDDTTAKAYTIADNRLAEEKIGRASRRERM